MQGLAAAIEGLTGDFVLKKVTGKKIGLQRIQAARKSALESVAQSVIEQGRAMRAQLEVPALVQSVAKKLVKKETATLERGISKLRQGFLSVDDDDVRHRGTHGDDSERMMTVRGRRQRKHDDSENRNSNKTPPSNIQMLRSLPPNSATTPKPLCNRICHD